ncbi:SDR family oxidoreductase [Bradyrhizobium sp. Pear77]|uniref:SDR family NAD(P)-dependent oxidoreductase n=1 Tax=Bradyrhizobium altum TaxID=1571202 RepID=UPI001E4C5CCC|nr:SDR family NAD(P)-dependent oxidoreductase [Bradyrhizobium altum]MCC8952765.1 SDR family oxidoreductase [Bradyrhizobium altum]
MSASGRLGGHHALVTGAGSGIGAAIAVALAREGAKVSRAGRRAAPLEAVAAELPPGSAKVLDNFDVTEPDAIARGVQSARKQFGTISILVNSAGEAPSAPLAKTGVALWDRVISIDLTGVFLVTQTVLPDLMQRGYGARLINVASTAGLTGYSYVATYCAAKQGVVGLTRALALELARSGATVNAVCPGFTETPLIERALADIVAKTGRSRDAVKDEFTKSNPQGRLVTPAEVADAVLWLASPGASSINGQAIVVAGGEVMS